MSTSSNVEILETTEYGTVLKCQDTEVADRFEDFLTEHCFVFFKTKMEPDEISFFFGQASSESKVRSLFESFIKLS